MNDAIQEKTAFGEEKLMKKLDFLEKRTMIWRITRVHFMMDRFRTEGKIHVPCVAA